MVANAKQRAKKAGVPFDLKSTDLTLPDRCPVLGIPLVTSGAAGDREFAPSLDRIVPSRGYVRDNVAIVSMRANRLKSDATAEELALLLAYILGARPKSPNRRPKRKPDG